MYMHDPLKEKSFALLLQEPCRPGDEGWPQESTLLRPIILLIADSEDAKFIIL